MSVRNALFKFRVMPLTIAGLGVLFSMKAYDVYRGAETLSQLLAPEAVAAGEEKPSEAEKAADDSKSGQPAKEIAEKPAEGKEAEPAKNADMAKAEDAKEADAKPAEQQIASLDKKAIEGAADEKSKKHYSQVELDILQSLSKRRDELDQWENDVRMKETLLGATEQKINDKIGEIKSLQNSVQKLLSKYNEHEDAKIRSLVKIYENMKPKAAAQIFDEMEMPILLEVIDKMSERKAAPILAQMKPVKAKEVTVQLAEQRKLFIKQQQAFDKMNQQ